MNATYAQHTQRLDEQISDALSRDDPLLAAQLYCNRAALHAKHFALEQALADCSTAIECDVTCAKAYLGRSKLFARNGDYERAIQDLEAAQRVDTMHHSDGSYTIGDIGQAAQRRENGLRKEAAAAQREAELKAKREAQKAEREAAARERAQERERMRREAAADAERMRREWRERSQRSNASFDGLFSSRSRGKPDHYGVLGVEPTADSDTIRKAYKKLCLKYHPDKASADANTPEKNEAKKHFLEVQKAYEVLSDESKRRSYDAGRPDCEMQ